MSDSAERSQAQNHKTLHQPAEVAVPQPGVGQQTSSTGPIFTSPFFPTIPAIIHLQSNCGNQAVQRLLSRADSHVFSRFDGLPPVRGVTAVQRQDGDTRTGDAERETILDDMLRGFDVSEDVRHAALRALGAFSISQLHQMQQAGVRFWGPGALPALFGDVQARPLSSLARYLPAVRVIQMSSRTSIGALRHELAHAWDHVSAMRRPQRLDDMNERQRTTAIAGRQSMRSQSPDRRATRDASGNPVRMTMEAMFQSYRGRVPRRELAFDGPSTSEGHSMTTVQDFYAEGYSVFHGSYQGPQSRLLRYAPELYNFLEQEAQSQRLPIPDRSALQNLER